MKYDKNYRECNTETQNELLIYSFRMHASVTMVKPMPLFSTQVSEIAWLMHSFFSNCHLFRCVMLLRTKFVCACSEWQKYIRAINWCINAIKILTYCKRCWIWNHSFRILYHCFCFDRKSQMRFSNSAHEFVRPKLCISLNYLMWHLKGREISVW